MKITHLRCWMCRWFKRDPEGCSIGVCEFRSGRPDVSERHLACEFYKENKMLPWAVMDTIYTGTGMTGGTE